MKRWPERDKTARRRDGPPGSWRGDGGQYLNPEQNAQADRLIDGLRRPEKSVTKQLEKIQENNPHGGVLAGLEHRLKGTDRLKEKIADKMGVKTAASPADAAATIDDAVRYTFCFSNEEYVDGYFYVQTELESAGYEMRYSKNHWLGDPQYKGVNSRWETPDGGRFELHFHTRDSFYAKEQLTHRSYNRLRSPSTSWQEMPELQAFQLAVSGALPRPSAAERIPDYPGGP